MSRRDYYEVLGVDRNASDAEIKKAYRTLAMEHHPDRNPGDAKAEELFKEASEAYQVLSEPEKRSAYDRFGHDGLRGMGHQGFSSFDDIFSSFGDIFGDLFGGAFAGSRARRDGPRQGRDLAYELEMTFEEAAVGVEREIEFERPTECVYCGGSGAKSPDAIRECPSCGGSGQMSYRQGFMTFSTACSDCGGAGRQVTEYCAECDGAGRRLEQRKVKVKIPPGVDESARLRLREEGEGGAKGGPAGDLFVVVSLLSHEEFERNGADVASQVSVTFSQAALGDTVRVRTLYGESELDIPKGVQSSDVLRLKGEGFQRLGRRGRGDHMFLVHVQTPTKLTPDEERLFGELSEIERDKAEKNGTGRVGENGAGKKGILEKLSSFWG
ncbi:MAG: molecular chaperone DnaJ [Nitrospinae bacterium]|nr:molecular chaperone DnaJ [Nitrospinota bacterium]